MRRRPLRAPEARPARRPRTARRPRRLRRPRRRPPRRPPPRLLLAALWGNQADLGFRTDNPDASTSAGEIVADDSDALWALADGPGDAPVIVVADNAGREITADLALVDHLLETGTGPVELHLKPHPYFVSDATGRDVLDTLDVLDRDPHEPVRGLAGRLRDAIRLGWLRLRAHGAYVHPTDYRTIPSDLADDFATAKLVILKGDLNYRRLVGDRQWDPTTPFSEAAGYFPARWRPCGPPSPTWPSASTPPGSRSSTPTRPTGASPAPAPSSR
nr:hypothetical protein GCM10025732_36320 [Glycomyces mayteni]